MGTAARTLSRIAIALILTVNPCGTASAQARDSLRDTLPPDTLSPDPARDAYLDNTARRLVVGAKAARDSARLTIDSYTALIRERMGVEAPSLRRDRPWVNGERAVRVRWSRAEPNVVHVLGARFRHPGIGPDDSEFFPGLRVERFAADPFEDPFNFGFAVAAGRRNAAITVRSPLDPDSEGHYQYRSGDTISVRLAAGQVLRAVEVTAIPRRRSIRLVSAILWIDPESHGLARVAYRLAKKVDREMSWKVRHNGKWWPGFWVNVRDTALAASPGDEPPSLFDRLANGVVNQTMPRMEMDVSAVVADYGLWEMRHWLPRSVRWKGSIGMGEGFSATDIAPSVVPMTIDWTLDIEDIRERGGDPAAGLPVTAAEALALWREEDDSIGGEPDSEDPDEVVTITPADREALTTSELLPPIVWEDDRGPDEATLDAIALDLAAIGTGEGGDSVELPSPWILYPPGKTLRLLRFNPVEHLALGTRLRRDFAWGSGEFTTRIGTARLQVPDIDLTIRSDHPRLRILFSAYRALRATVPGERTSGSLAAYASGDAEDFHWSHGASVRFLPPSGERDWLSLRLFAEQDADIGADGRRNRAGALAVWKPWWGGIEAGSLGGGGRATVRGSAGDNSYVRASVQGALVLPLPANMSFGIRAGAARVWGDPSPQDLWRIGGTGTWLRGHSDPVRASRIHMARVDLQRPIRFFRLSVFGDWASAGGEDFYAVGTGMGFMEGMMRVDLARGLRMGREGGPDAVLRVHVLGDTFF